MNEIVCFSCLKIGHVGRNSPTRSPALRNEFNKGKGKVDVEKVKIQMNETWRKKEDCSTSIQDEVTLSNDWLIMSPPTKESKVSMELTSKKIYFALVLSI